MITLESLFQGIFTGFCSYLGIRTAKTTHNKFKKIKINNIYKKLKKWFLK